MTVTEAPSGPAKHRLEFLDSRPETSEVITFRFGLPPPERFHRQAGQHLEMTLEGVDDPRGPTHLFTISSSPTEEEFLTITTRMTGSPFKERLRSLRRGEMVDLLAPDGDFVLAPGRPALMVAGGIGITPFRSMLRFATDTRLEKPLVLLYSNKTPEDIAFRAELDQLAQRNHAIRLMYTVTRPQESKQTWNGRTGRIDAGFAREALRGVRHPLIYFAGPPKMVEDDVKLFREELGIPESDIRTDVFDGY